MAKKDEILDSAERRIRAGGYFGFSFRDIAEDTRIKSASVHYHFPTKEDLAAAVAERYASRFMDALGAPTDDPKAQMTTAFRRALTTDDLMCLCGVLGAESSILPQPVMLAVRAFFTKAADWLEAALAPASDARKQALRHVAMLEGAMLMARAATDNALFDEIVDP